MWRIVTFLTRVLVNIYIMLLIIGRFTNSRPLKHVLSLSLNFATRLIHNATFVIKTDHKPLKYLLDSPMKNRKIQLWALGISGYNCRIEDTAGTINTCADLLLRTLNGEEVQQGKTMEEEPDISDKTLEVNFIDSSQINPKEYASADVESPDQPLFKDVSEFEGIICFKRKTRIQKSELCD